MVDPHVLFRKNQLSAAERGPTPQSINAGWDEDLLAAERAALISADLDFDIGLTGLSVSEMDGLRDSVAPEEP